MCRYSGRNGPIRRTNTLEGETPWGHDSTYVNNNQIGEHRYSCFCIQYLSISKYSSQVEYTKCK